jgi:hypothetical protein
VSRSISIEANAIELPGFLEVPERARSTVLFAHGSGSSRFSPRNTFVARRLRQAHIGTLLFDLLTREEKRIDERSGELRFDILLLTRRLLAATRWVRAQPDSSNRVRSSKWLHSPRSGSCAIWLRTNSRIRTRANDRRSPKARLRYVRRYSAAWTALFGRLNAE